MTKLENRVCPPGHAIFLDNWIRKIFQNPKKIAGEFIKQDDFVIDLGCGPGFFTIDMAKMAGKNGKVIAIDLQKEMLEMVKKKAVKYGVGDIITYHQCKSDTLAIITKDKADFILAYYMLHETPNVKFTLKEIKQLLKKNGKLLVVEPKMHVNKNLYLEMINDAENLGYKVLDKPKKKGGYSVLLTV